MVLGDFVCLLAVLHCTLKAVKLLRCFLFGKTLLSAATGKKKKKKRRSLAELYGRMRAAMTE